MGWLGSGQIQRDRETRTEVWFPQHGRLSLTTVWGMWLLPDVTTACPLTISGVTSLPLPDPHSPYPCPPSCPQWTAIILLYLLRLICIHIRP